MIGKKTQWEPKQIAYIKANHDKKSNKEIARYLGLTLTVVRNKKYELGLAKYNQKEKAWSESEDEILRSLYKTTGDVQLSKIIGKPKGGVRKRRITLGLVRDIDQINKLVEKNLSNLKPYTFKPGHKAENNPKKAWDTRRRRDNMPVEQILKRIDHRERANFYRPQKEKVK